MNIRNRKFFPILTLLLLSLLAGTNVQAEVRVDLADPSTADQGTLSLPVTITGSGFEKGASVHFLQAGTKKGGGISVNSVLFVSESELLANIDVAVDAVVGDYDIEVRISRGRKGKGSTKLFTVSFKDSGTDLGQDIAMRCFFKALWGDGGTDTVKGDMLVDYVDGEDKVYCGVGGPSRPWPLGLLAAAKGNPNRAVRRIEIALDKNTFRGDGPDGIPGTDDDGLNFLPEHIFNEEQVDPESDPAEPDLDDMEVEVISVRPYRDIPEQSADGIHLMKGYPATMLYEVAMNFSTWTADDSHFRISLAGTHVPGNEKFQGLQCEVDNATAQAIIAGGPVEDVTVYLWPDNDGDNLPDGYTVTTGVITDIGDPPGTLPTTSDESRVAAICSSIGPESCGNPQAPALCNFLGYVDMQLTLHAEIK